MSMMHVRIMRMLVNQFLVTMRVAVRLRAVPRKFV